MTNRLARIALAGLGLGLLTACSSSAPSAQTKPTTTAPTSTTAPPGVAKITTFDVPATVQCGAGPSITFTVGYAVTGAKTVQLLVDGRDNPGLAATGGSVEVPVHCDAVAHTVVLMAVDANGGTTTQQKTLETELPPA